MSNVIGNVVVSGPIVQWTIQDFFLMFEKYCISSPIFQYENILWNFKLYPNGFGRYYSGWLSLYLKPHKFQYLYDVVGLTLGIKDKDGLVYIGIRSEEECEVDAIGSNSFLERSKLLNDRTKVERDKKVTIFCNLTMSKSFKKPEKLITGEMNIISDRVKADENVDSKDTNRNEKGADRALQNLKSLLLSKENSDVTLKVMDQEFRVHRLILGAQSSVFSSMFKHNTVEKSSGIVDITDCDPVSFQEFLLYLYSGKVEKMTTGNILGLYTTADKYDVAELKEECVDFMMKEMSVDTFCDFFALALRHNESTLLEVGIAFFVKNTKKIIVTVEWKSFMKENTDAANELYIKACDENYSE